MTTFTRFSTLLVAFFVLLAAIGHAARFDGGGWPVGVIPSSSTVNVGESVGFSVSVNQSGSTPTTVYLTSSNSSVLQVPPVVIIPAGNAAAYFTGTTSAISGVKALKSRSLGTTVTITASANGRSAETNVTVQ